MAGIDCIGKGYKDLMATLISRDVAKNILVEVLNGMPICEPRKYVEIGKTYVAPVKE